jgi:uncharacterized protein
MEFTEAKIGRIFILRLHQDEVLHEVIEKFASKKNVSSALCFFLGGAEDKSKVVVGPREGEGCTIDPMVTLLKGIHEACGVGTIFVNQEGKPKLHMHAAFGRDDKAVAGCVRMGVKIWLIGEVVILELTGSTAKRAKNKESSFEVLDLS